ncbi:MAG TPA: nuclear transport factor 2 family protein [Burkholderiales bacterium]|nr:nuclear transport factor 2 family protein [Burkholderiales bacterium]
MACARTSDEVRIRDAIAAMQQAAEERRPRDFIAYVDADFTGNEGVDREALANLLRLELLRNERIGVTLGPIDIDVQGTRATARMSATLTGGSGGLLPERGAVYSIATAWRKQGGDWRCYNAEWKQTL